MKLVITIENIDERQFTNDMKLRKLFKVMSEMDWSTPPRPGYVIEAVSEVVARCEYQSDEHVSGRGTGGKLLGRAAD